MAFEYQATRDTSGLVDATGYWSGNTIYINPDPSKMVVIDQELQVRDFPPLIREYLEKHLASDIRLRLEVRQSRQKQTFLEMVSSGLLKDAITINHASVFDRAELRSYGSIAWSRVAEWLSETYATENEQRAAFADLIANEALSTPSVIRSDKRSVGLHGLIHPWLSKTLDAWIADGTPIEETLEMLATLAFDEMFSIPGQLTPAQFNARSLHLLDSLRGRGVFAYRHFESDRLI